MSRSQYKASSRSLIGPIVVVVLLVWGALVYYFYGLSAEIQTYLLVTVSILIVAGITLIIYLLIRRRWQRQQAWLRATAYWRQGPQDGQRAVRYDSARALSPAHLEKFTADLFKQMGYKVVHTGKTGDHGVDVHLVNPLGQVELVQCKQWQHPVGEPEVRDLAGAMVHEGASKGFIIAPGGFSESARRWAKGQAIILADEGEIGRLVEIAYSR
jgi:hypothetical protein